MHTQSLVPEPRGINLPLNLQRHRSLMLLMRIKFWQSGLNICCLSSENESTTCDLIIWDECKTLLSLSFLLILVSPLNFLIIRSTHQMHISACVYVCTVHMRIIIIFKSSFSTSAIESQWSVRKSESYKHLISHFLIMSQSSKKREIE